MSKYPKLNKMIVRNFRAIKESAEIELNDIVILVGANNSGKSTFLKAYDLAVNSEKLSVDDFPDCDTSTKNLPEVEIHTIVDKETAPKIELWCEPIDDHTYRVKEKWIWKNTKDKPERVGYLIKDGRWATESDTPRMPWATDNVAGARRPKPHRVSTFDSPEVQSDAIKEIVTALLEEKIKKFKPKKQPDDFPTLLGKFENLKQEFTEISKEEVKIISNDITDIVKKIIPNHEFIFSIEDALKDDPFKIFDAKDIEIRFGVGDKLFPIINHGSGARRTLLWAVLKKLAEMGFEAKNSQKGKKYEEIKSSTSHILLMDEPEISLHPMAIRDACNVLYSLPDNDLWQVMVTTHTPSFIDLTKDHTTIIRVEKENNEKILTTTLYQAESIELTPDEKENLKLLNLVDPHVLEFFFGGDILLVEGDTEYNAFNFVKDKEKNLGNPRFNDLLVIRARGKVQVSLLMKILNHFKKKYFVLHDTDKLTAQRKHLKKDDKGKKYYEVVEIGNPAWTNNKKIQENMSEFSTVYASIINFEIACFKEVINSGKPANIIEKLKIETNYKLIKSILEGILDNNLTDENFTHWTKIEEIEKLVQIHPD